MRRWRRKKTEKALEAMAEEYAREERESQAAAEREAAAEERRRRELIEAPERKRRAVEAAARKRAEAEARKIRDAKAAARRRVEAEAQKRRETEAAAQREIQRVAEEKRAAREAYEANFVTPGAEVVVKYSQTIWKEGVCSSYVLPLHTGAMEQTFLQGLKAGSFQCVSVFDCCACHFLVAPSSSAAVKLGVCFVVSSTEKISGTRHRPKGRSYDTFGGSDPMRSHQTEAHLVNLNARKNQFLRFGPEFPVLTFAIARKARMLQFIGQLGFKPQLDVPHTVDEQKETPVTTTEQLDPTHYGGGCVAAWTTTNVCVHKTFFGLVGKVYQKTVENEYF